MDLKIIDGNLFDATEQYLCHQCNCITTKAAHLAAAMFARFPEADVYSPRQSSPTRGTPSIDEQPGMIAIRGRVIALFGQYYPSFPRYPDSKRDGYAAREGYFKQCLQRITGIPGLKSIAFPFQIGCGAAGGDWAKYRHMIREFAEDNPTVKVRVYRLPGAK